MPNSDELDSILPPTITAKSARSGNEWVIPFPEVSEAVNLASRHSIAVLGVEVFRVMADGIGLVAQSAYEYELKGSWPEYVDQNNHAALGFVRLNPLRAGYGYILTSTSQDEHRNLKR